MTLPTGSAILSIVLALTASVVAANDFNALTTLSKLPNSSLMVAGQLETNRYSVNPDTALIPASTLKILTAWLALEHWGQDHRFVTDFFADDQGVLSIKGYGDPFLISEEISLMALALKTSGLQRVTELRVDSSYFSPKLQIDGQTQTDNPYDATSGALAANFNTLFLRKTRTRVLSAETQTPLTPTAKHIGNTLKTGKHRVNIKNPEQGSVYFAEILREKLAEIGVPVSGTISQATIPKASVPFYRHHNQHNLGQIIAAMLQYSTNFIANQLFLILGAEHSTAPATLEKSQRYAHSLVAQKFGWKHFKMLDGAGLSRNNRMTARQLVQLLRSFAPYQHLMHARSPGITAKTGTLKNVSSYAGYLNHEGREAVFALIINSPAPADFRFDITDWLLTQLASDTTQQHPASVRR